MTLLTCHCFGWGIFGTGIRHDGSQCCGSSGSEWNSAGQTLLLQISGARSWCYHESHFLRVESSPEYYTWTLVKHAWKCLCFPGLQSGVPHSHLTVTWESPCFWPECISDQFNQLLVIWCSHHSDRDMREDQWSIHTTLTECWYTRGSQNP